MTGTVDYAAVRQAAAVVGRRLEAERRQRIARRDGTRYYTEADLGPLCSAGCGTRIVKPLLAAGITQHPSCDHASILREQCARSWGL